MSAIDKATTVLEGLFRTLRIGECTLDIYEAAKDDELTTFQKTHRIVTNGLVITGEAVAYRERNSKDEKKLLKIKAFVGAADISSQVSQKSCKKEPLNAEDYFEIANIVFMRTADVVSTSIEKGLVKDCFSDVKSEKLRNFVQDEEKLKKLAKGIKVLNVIRGCGYRMYQSKNNHEARKSLRQQRAQARAANAYTAPAVNPTASNVPQATQGARPEFSADIEDVRYGFEFEELLTLDIGLLDYIPVFLEDRFNGYPRCPITRKPIRFVVHVINPQNPQNPVYYEGEALRQWMRENRTQSPTGWPSTVLYSFAHVHPDDLQQKRIDQLLQQCQNELHP